MRKVIKVLVDLEIDQLCHRLSGISQCSLSGNFCGLRQMVAGFGVILISDDAISYFAFFSGGLHLLFQGFTFSFGQFEVFLC